MRKKNIVILGIFLLVFIVLIGLFLIGRPKSDESGNTIEANIASGSSVIEDRTLAEMKEEKEKRKNIKVTIALEKNQERKVPDRMEIVTYKTVSVSPDEDYIRKLVSDNAENKEIPYVRVTPDTIVESEETPFNYIEVEHGFQLFKNVVPDIKKIKGLTTKECMKKVAGVLEHFNIEYAEESSWTVTEGEDSYFGGTLIKPAVAYKGFPFLMDIDLHYEVNNHICAPPFMHLEYGDTGWNIISMDHVPVLKGTGEMADVLTLDEAAEKLQDYLQRKVTSSGGYTIQTAKLGYYFKDEDTAVPTWYVCDASENDNAGYYIDACTGDIRDSFVTE